MSIGTVRPGDIVLIDRKGRVFYAVVVVKQQRALEVEPIDNRISYRVVKAREVIEIWHRSRQRTGVRRCHEELTA